MARPNKRERIRDPLRFRSQWYHVATGDRGEHLGVFGSFDEVERWLRSRPANSYYRVTCRELETPDQAPGVFVRFIATALPGRKTRWQRVNRFHSITREL